MAVAIKIDMICKLNKVLSIIWNDLVTQFVGPSNDIHYFLIQGGLRDKGLQVNIFNWERCIKLVFVNTE